ncbi:MAG: uracil-DNA glycosylase family protein [Labrys sp. (in: a-proteobacteria)]
MSSPSAAELLAWYVAMGVDVAIGEEPVDRYAEASAAATRAAQPAASGAAPAVASARSAAPVPPAPPFGAPPFPTPMPMPVEPARSLLTEAPDTVVAAAREIAMAATDLDALRAALEAFEGCALKATATRLVFADGAPDARLMLVGEAPGRDEDLQGRPFVGRSGQLLDRMLAAIGLDRTKVYIANVVPWRPPGNRTPSPQETAVCRPFIARQIELVDPDILICLGAPAAQTLLGAKEGILRLRGQWSGYHTGRRAIQAMATLHPAYLLRQPVQKRLVWRDFRALAAALAALPLR